MGLSVDLPDLLVASIALGHDVPVVTGNHAHFDKVRDAAHRFTIENWRDPSPEG